MTESVVSKQRRHLRHAAWLACCLAGPPACDGSCEPPLDAPGNQDPVSLDPCPPLPAGVDPIEGLVSGHASDRFGGLTLTLSTRPLACGEPAVQHGYCGGDERSITLGFPEEELSLGVHALGPLYVEFEQPGTTSVGGGGQINQATVELYAITEACVTGRIAGLAAADGPFDGGFQAPRCTP